MTGRPALTVSLLSKHVAMAEQPGISRRQARQEAVQNMLASGSQAGDRLRANRIAMLLEVRFGCVGMVQHVA